ncbi:hypothetical protein [Mycolicibacterium helvum]|uniref:hypothetical protein n=1 Tax=Mycolicibacterium helvum TaxID=1534349 RepID=UPI0013D47BDF|nr:hypothetical protein [Mycolicibacterium helvum]
MAAVSGFKAVAVAVDAACSWADGWFAGWGGPADNSWTVRGAGTELTSRAGVATPISVLAVIRAVDALCRGRAAAIGLDALPGE